MENDVLDVDYVELDEYRTNKIFENQCEKTPYDVALHAIDGELTFKELNEMSNIIANSLIKKGVSVEDRVMILLDKNSNFVASMFGILKTGAAFIAIDSDYPKDRIVNILKDSKSKYVIVDNIIRKKDIDLSEFDDKLLNIEDLFEDINITNPNINISPNNAAYIIYTSGSTGLPKGVVVEHKNLANFAYPHPDNIFMHEIAKNSKKENYKVLSTTTVSFDIFIKECVCPLLNGVPVVFADSIQSKDPGAMMKLIEDTNANVFSTTPSKLLYYLELDEMKGYMANFKLYLIGGEPFPPRLCDLLNKDAKIFNTYGPTEVTMSSNSKLIENKNISVGKPLLNVFEQIMDYDENPLPANAIGELYIAGKGVSREYLNRPVENKKSYRTLNGIKFFKSGDYAKLRYNGEIDILGRSDNQIKLRGLRIEIGEIESVFSQQNEISSVVVVVKKINNQEILCAYFTVHDEYKKKNLDEGEYSIDIDGLKDKLSKKFVYYMIPSIYVELDDMPLTFNHKIDLKALPDPVLISNYVEPENEIEEFFANVFANILGLDKVGVTDNFFEIGGTSLLVTKIVIEALNNDYNIHYEDIFKYPTPRELGEFLSDSKEDDLEYDDYEYDDIDNLLMENNLDSIANGEFKKDFGNVLLTGATGFLGVHVLNELLENESVNVYCLVRSKDDMSAKDRLKSILNYYFDDDYEILLDKRLHVIDGDVTNYEDFEKLENYNINTIFNCAGNVKHFSHTDDIKDVNVNGVANGLKFARLNDCKYIQISTSSVASKRRIGSPYDEIKLSENNLYIGQIINSNKYVESKFLAERLVLESSAKYDLDVKIMRVGNLMARSNDYKFQINYETNAFINYIKSYLTIRKVPFSMKNKTFELSPIDVVAKSVIALSKTPKQCRVFNVFSNKKASFDKIIENLNKLSDYKCEFCGEKEYRQILDSLVTDKSMDSLFGIIINTHKSEKNEKWVFAKNDYTLEVLHQLGIEWPDIDDVYIYEFMKNLKELGFFNINGD